MPEPTRDNPPGNRLASSSSPYLRQHAHNPVDWWPWSGEAFARARERDVPVLLSIGYATCYWCHVMERESFESPEVAAVLNDEFVCIKLDREQRPDLDEIYMAATVVMRGHGGWPMTVLLEPEQRRPFWCATYLPPEPARGLPGLVDTARRIGHAWRHNRDQVLEQADRLADAVRDSLATRAQPAPVGIAQIQQAGEALLRSFDRTHGGFGGAPKFPQPELIALCLDLSDAAGDDATRQSFATAARVTLDRMAIGGVRDQLSGGFHRYAVDATWTVPHFEKMLYDQGQLLTVYARAAELFDDAGYRRVCREITDDVLGTMTADGAFISAIDAEVAGREGLSYLWNENEVRAAVGDEDADFALRVFGLDRGPNFADPHHPGAPAANVLRLAHRPEQIAADLGVTEPVFLDRLDRVRAAMLAVRNRRDQPIKDTKVIASWNGLMIAGLARAARVLGDNDLLERAQSAARTVIGSLGLLTDDPHRCLFEGAASEPAMLDDLAMLAGACVELGAASEDPEWLDTAAGLIDRCDALFAETDAEFAYFDSQARASDSFVRPSSKHDGAMPSGNSALLAARAALAFQSRNARAIEAARAHLAAVSGEIRANPLGPVLATRTLLAMIRGGAVEPGEPAPAEGPRDAVPSYVEVFASEERISVGREQPAALDLRLRIAEGHHVIAADPGDTGAPLIPFRVHAIGGEGIAVYADYPEGVERPEGVRAYEGQFDLRVVVECTGQWKGRPLLVMTYQVCSKDACYEPRSVELDVAIDRVD
ncbi:MAG: thioredoxin domain-containing protein [Phycisphaerales bacterium JB037]